MKNSAKTSFRVVTGTHALRELMRIHLPDIDHVWVPAGWERGEYADTLRKLKPQQVQVKSTQEMQKTAGNHQGCIAFVRTQPQVDWAQLQKAKKSVVVALDHIGDPHNLGAVLRTAWLTGVDALLIPEDRQVGLTPTVHKVACGGAEHVPVEAGTLTHQLQRLKDMGYWVFGLAGEAKQSFFQIQKQEKVVWVFGSEEKGLRKTTRDLCDELVQLPQMDAAQSYNVSVTAGVVLVQSFAQSKL